MSHFIYTADRSVTANGWVGLVIDSRTQRIVTRTLHAYVTRELAIVAAKRAHLWGVQQQEVA